MGAKEPLFGHGQAHQVRQTTGEEAAFEVCQVSGSVRWFDPSKGYGFIVPDQDLPDVLLHVTCLRRDGFQTAREGARVVCERDPAAEGLAGIPHSRHGQIDRGAPLAITATYPCCRRPGERLGKSNCEVA